MDSLLIPVPFEHRIVASCDDFFSVPTVGQIVEGYSLVFPKRDVLNLSQLCAAERQSLLSFAGKLALTISRCFGNSIVFEHGACSCDLTSCGVNRAHLHVVPFESAEKVVAELDRNFQQTDVRPSFEKWLLCKEPAKRPYMMIGRIDGPIYEYDYGETRESQCIRRIIARLTPGNPEWDWKKAGQEEKLWRTLQVLRTAINEEVPKEPTPASV